MERSDIVFVFTAETVYKVYTQESTLSCILLQVKWTPIVFGNGKEGCLSILSLFLTHFKPMGI